MDITAKSNLLFRRHDALAVFVAIASLGKDDFVNEDIAKLAGVKGSTLSDELSRLVQLGAVERTSRKGNFRRRPTVLWELAEKLQAEWTS